MKIVNYITSIITNYPELIDFYKFRLQHWQIETYHKIKDTWLNEDRYL